MGVMAWVERSRLPWPWRVFDTTHVTRSWYSHWEKVAKVRLQNSVCGEGGRGGGNERVSGGGGRRGGRSPW